MTGGGGRQRPKSDVQIIEDILRRHGPLHAWDIVQLATPEGANFQGRKTPTVMARDKMLRSKRFVLFGRNVWGLPGQEYRPGPVPPDACKHQFRCVHCGEPRPS